MKKLTENQKSLMWEIVGYIGLILCVFGQVAVGYLYLVAQAAYLIANVSSVIRDFALNLPAANKVKDIVFTGITVALIIIYI